MKDKFPDVKTILDAIPHRYPFLLVDRVLEVKPGESITALKNVTFNEPYFQGHFPGEPIMPGVLQIEALAQASALLHYLSCSEKGAAAGQVFLFAGIDKIRFKRIVRPGDQLTLHIQHLRSKRGITKLAGLAQVDGQLACEGELLTAMPREDVG